MNSDEILNEVELAILKLLQEGSMEMDATAKTAGLNQSQVLAAGIELHQRGLVSVSELERLEIIPEEGVADLISKGLPERRASDALKSAGGEMSLEGLMDWAGEMRLPLTR